MFICICINLKWESGTVLIKITSNLSHFFDIESQSHVVNGCFSSIITDDLYE